VSALQWYVVLSSSIGAVFTVAMIGQPRKPTTPGAAAIVVVFYALIVVAAFTVWAP
jgi:hypothetical protein